MNGNKLEIDFCEKAKEVIDVIRKDKIEGYWWTTERAIEAGNQLAVLAAGVSEKILDAKSKEVRKEIPYEYPYAAVWWYSVLLEIQKNAGIFGEFIQYLHKKREVFSENTQYFLFYQLMCKMFLIYHLNSLENTSNLWEFYIKIMDGFAAKINMELMPVAKEKRNDDLVIVITEQFLNVLHGPTKTALDRCVTLMRKCKKKVILINTGEVLSQVGGISFYRTVVANYDVQKSMDDVQYWRSVKIPYLQCDNEMPNLEMMEYLLREIRQMAPGHVIFIGKGGVLGSLIGRMFPTLAVGLCPSVLEFTTAKYQTLGRSLNEDDIELLKKVGYTKEHVIESVFTSGLKPQMEHVTRKQIGLPGNAFIVCVISTRLDEEVSAEFLETVDAAFASDMFLVFWGERFNGYNTRLQKFLNLRERSLYLGVCDDILSRLELCDLYLNPIRRGGGTSCVEAMSKGVPVVTVDFGDVAVNAGEEFCVKDYEEMKGKIRRYYDDKVFYQEMSELAKKRAAVLLDSDTEFVKIMQEMDRREMNLEKRDV